MKLQKYLPLPQKRIKEYTELFPYNTPDNNYYKYSIDFQIIQHLIFQKEFPNNPPRKQKNTSCDTLFVVWGAIRLIAQGCTCANCPSVSTERWFGAHSARRFENPPIHPAPQRKTAQKSPHQASDTAKLWLCVLSVLVLRASIGCAVVPRKSC